MRKTQCNHVYEWHNLSYLLRSKYAFWKRNTKKPILRWDHIIELWYLKFAYIWNTKYLYDKKRN